MFKVAHHSSMHDNGPFQRCCIRATQMSHLLMLVGAHTSPPPRKGLRLNSRSPGEEPLPLPEGTEGLPWGDSMSMHLQIVPPTIPTLKALKGVPNSMLACLQTIPLLRKGFSLSTGTFLY